jgi:hypothetical protein
MTRLISSLALTLLVAGCVINNNKYPRPRDLPVQSIVTGLRILAISAEPPEIRPGEQAQVRALLVDPDAVTDLVVWVVCEGQAATDFGCPFDPTGLDTATPEELLARGVIGVEPLFPPIFTAPEGILEGLDDRKRQEGVNFTVQALALPVPEDPDTSASADINFNEVESGFKRLIVGEAPTPNHNPGIEGVTVDGADIPSGATFVIDPGEPYEIGLRLAPDAIESYQYLNIDGEVETRTEEPFVEWYSTAGDVEEFNVLYARDPTLGGVWVAPQEPGMEGTFWAVLKDRRGGVSWTSRRWRVRSGNP